VDGTWGKFWSDQDGVMQAETVLLVGLVALVAFGAIQLLGERAGDGADFLTSFLHRSSDQTVTPAARPLR
jgi:Flp pilus assembly pilin Flp